MSMVRLIVNGAERNIDLGEAPTVAALLRDLAPAGVPCAVELNRSVVPSIRHGTTALTDGDRVELVTFVGGG